MFLKCSNTYISSKSKVDTAESFRYPPTAMSYLFSHDLISGFVRFLQRFTTE